MNAISSYYTVFQVTSVSDIDLEYMSAFFILYNVNSTKQ